MSLDMYELAKEYCELVSEKEQVDEGDMPEDEFDRERYEVLKYLNDELGGDILSYPNRAGEIIIIEDNKKALADYGIQVASDMEYIADSCPLYSHVDWAAFGEEEIQQGDFQLVGFEGTDYYFIGW